MSYLDPQSWTDVDSAGNPLSWTTRANKLMYPGHEMIRRAILERWKALDGPNVEPSIGTYLTQRIPGKMPDRYWLYRVDQAITWLITRTGQKCFINHEQNSGNWNGQYDINPTTYDYMKPWNETDLLTSIGDPSRIRHSGVNNTISLAAFTLQTYKILNKLRWTRYTLDQNTDGVGYQIKQYSVGDPWGPPEKTHDELWAELVAAWPGVSWTTGGPFIRNGAYGTFRKYDSGFWRKVARADRFRSKSSAPIYDVDGKQCQIDWYIWMGDDPSADRDWLDEGLPISKSSWWKHQSDDGPYIGPTTAVSNYPTLLDQLPPKPITYPAEPGAGWPYQTYGGWWSGSPYYAGYMFAQDTGTRAIIKWDITGGFQFVA